ncbi:mitochondrial transcription termination factorfamily protein [Striga asiatica]|uniref:Mitochondrial transcription termination factorfamily protein n=1 Tax=Striga asiatica TaxID=4170 RepID=A0A5A7PDD2_STRAF|nr:mitochondrial transcription termination factorfamily protein [Striga asiatica]
METHRISFYGGGVQISLQNIPGKRPKGPSFLRAWCRKGPKAAQRTTVGRKTLEEASLFLVARCIASIQVSTSANHPRCGMVGKSLAAPLLAFDSIVHLCSYHNIVSIPTGRPINVNFAITTQISRNWELRSTAQVQDTVLSKEDNRKWESCKRALSAFGFPNEENEKILGKAFGQIHSPYWGEERKKEVPEFEAVNEILSYLKNLGLSDDDIGKIIKKFPEVLGCSLESEVKENVRILEKEWGIKGNTLRNLLLRNPKALGYNIDCKGDCMAQCTRCWARF